MKLTHISNANFSVLFSESNSPSSICLYGRLWRAQSLQVSAAFEGFLQYHVVSLRVRLHVFSCV